VLEGADALRDGANYYSAGRPSPTMHLLELALCLRVELANKRTARTRNL